jgi:tetratricopeptide (TPR) repeat protein
MYSSNINATSIPWPTWLIRYIASDDRNAFNDVIWSVGGSPPYGGVSYEEASAVYDLLESHLGQGMAPESAYEKVRQFIDKKPERLYALEAFHCYDHIKSSPDAYSEQDITNGIALSNKLDNEGLQAFFISLQAQLLYKAGEISKARQLIDKALSIFVTLASKDHAYTKRVADLTTNAASFMVMDADFATARKIMNQLADVGDKEGFDRMHKMLGDDPTFDKESSVLIEKADDLLYSGNLLKALECYTEIERRALLNRDEVTLCSILGQKAVAFTHIGNVRRAIDTYQQAITYCRKNEDYLNLSRWSGNLGKIFLERNEFDLADRYFKESMDASVHTKRADSISIAIGNYSALLGRQERFQEAIEFFDKAAAAYPIDNALQSTWRDNKFAIYLEWASRLRREGQISEALKIYNTAINQLDITQEEHIRSAASLYVEIAGLNEHLGDLKNALVALDKSIALYSKLEDRDTEMKLKSLRIKLNEGSVRFYG